MAETDLDRVEIIGPVEITQQEPERGRLETFLTQHREIITFSSVAVAILAFVFTVYQHGRTVRADRDKEVRDQAMAAAKDKYDSEIRRLETEKAQLERRNNIISTLDIVSRNADNLAGTATLSSPENNEKKISSNVAVMRYAPDFAQVSTFEVDVQAVEGLNALSRVLVRNMARDEETDFTTSYIAPVIIAKCQSQDPAEAAGALVVCGQIFNGSGLLDELRSELNRQNTLPKSSRQGGSGPSTPKADTLATTSGYGPQEVIGWLERVFKERNYSKVDFGGLECDFSTFNFARANFRNTRFSNSTKFNKAVLSGADFSDVARMEDAELTEVKGDSDARPVNFTGALVVKCKKWDKAVLNKALFDRVTLTECDVHDADLRGTKFRKAKRGAEDVSANIERCAFTNCNFAAMMIDSPNDIIGRMLQESRTEFVDCIMSNTSFEKCDLSRVVMSGKIHCTVRGGVAKRATFGAGLDPKSLFIGVDLSGADFGETSITGEMFARGCRVDWMIVSDGSASFVNEIVDKTSGGGAGDDSEIGRVKMADGSVLILVRKFVPPKENPPMNPPKYSYAGVLNVVNGRFQKNVSPDALYAAVSSLDDDEREERGLPSRIGRDWAKLREAIVSGWGIEVPDVMGR